MSHTRSSSEGIPSDKEQSEVQLAPARQLVLGDLDTVPSTIWEDADDLQAAMDYLEQHLKVSFTQTYEEWLLAKFALFYYKSTRPSGLMCDVLTFVREIFVARRTLVDMGYPEIEVNSWLKYSEPSVQDAVEYFSKSHEQQVREYDEHVEKLGLNSSYGAGFLAGGQSGL